MNTAETRLFAEMDGIAKGKPESRIDEVIYGIAGIMVGVYLGGLGGVMFAVLGAYILTDIFMTSRRAKRPPTEAEVYGRVQKAANFRHPGSGYRGPPHGLDAPMPCPQRPRGPSPVLKAGAEVAVTQSEPL